MARKRVVTTKQRDDQMQNTPQKDQHSTNTAQHQNQSIPCLFNTHQGQPGKMTHVIYLHRAPCRLHQPSLAPPLHGRESHQEARTTYHRGSGLFHLHDRLLQRHHPSFRLGEAGVGGRQLRGESRNLCRGRLGCPVSHGDGRDDRRQQHWRWSQLHAE